jgi:hypothetical protein
MESKRTFPDKQEQPNTALVACDLTTSPPVLGTPWLMQSVKRERLFSAEADAKAATR